MVKMVPPGPPLSPFTEGSSPTPAVFLVSPGHRRWTLTHECPFKDCKHSYHVLSGTLIS